MKYPGIILLAALWGCTSPKAADLAFSDAVRQSVREHGGQKCVVVDLEPDGSMSIAGRPTKVSEVRNLTSVSGIPVPVIVLIEVHRVANHEAIQTISDACKSNGIEMVIVKGILKGSDRRNIRAIP